MIGLIPACGTATRMGGIPKMLLPTPNGVLFERLLQQMRRVHHIEVAVGSTYPTSHILRNLYGGPDGTCDIVTMSQTATMTETLCRLSNHVGRHSVLFGMPDTYIENEEVFEKLYWALLYGAKIAVALFRARSDQHAEGGMCILDATGRVTGIVDKSSDRSSEWIWGAMAWTSEFWKTVNPLDEHIGYSVARAIQDGVAVDTVKMEGGFWDCGTPDRYFRLIDHLRG